MPCYYPILALQAEPGGELELFHRDQAHLREGRSGKHLEVPCGQCAGCRRRRSLEWAVRCMHEKQMYAHSCYITLTYNNEHLPQNGTLVHRDWQLFIKKLRNKHPLALENLLSREGSVRTTSTEAKLGTTVQQDSNNPAQAYQGSAWEVPSHTLGHVRFYMCGEYGQLGRPHFHALLFGTDFPDKIYYFTTESGEKIYRSAELETLWTKGFSSVGNVTFNSAAYISRYVMKKRTGDGNRSHYEILDPETGEIYVKKKEYNCMSRRPGIAAHWWKIYKSDVTTSDKVITRSGRILRPPRYYDRLLKRHDRALLEGHKHARELQALAQAAHHTPARLAVQEIVATRQAENQRRHLS